MDSRAMFVSNNYATSYAQNNINTPTMSNTPEQQEIIELSKQKWLWMADKNVDSLNALFHAKSIFVHMGEAGEKSVKLMS